MQLPIHTREKLSTAADKLDFNNVWNRVETSLLPEVETTGCGLLLVEVGSIGLQLMFRAGSGRSKVFGSKSEASSL